VVVEEVLQHLLQILLLGTLVLEHLLMGWVHERLHGRPLEVVLLHGEAQEMVDERLREGKMQRGPHRLQAQCHGMILQKLLLQVYGAHLLLGYTILI
jgi:hypothetical protein